MSKTSPKQRYMQTMSWLNTFKQSTDKPKRESRMNHYKNKGGR